MNAFDSLICLSRSKPRIIRSAWGGARRRLRVSPSWTDEAPMATRRPPGRSSALERLNDAPPMPSMMRS